MPITLTRTGLCPACRGSHGHQLLFKLDRFDVFRCPCGLRFIDPSLDGKSMMEIYRSSETLREINPALEHYYEYDTLDPQSLTCRDYSGALKEVGRVTPGRELLEVGCGTGSFLEFAKAKGWQVTGVDSSPENIGKLRERGIEGEAADFLTLSTSKRFDVIVLWDLIEHPQDPTSFVEKSWELLNEKGLLLIATPHDPSLLSLLAGALYRLSRGRIKFPVRQLYILEHTSYFSLKTLRALLEKGGFRVVKAWKTETDLERYHFSPLLRTGLRGAFFLARCLGLQNRLIAVARKVV